MSNPLQAAVQGWSPPILLTAGLGAAAFVYLHGWIRLRSASQQILPAWRAVSFLLGVFLVWLALGSPLAAFDEQLLTVHMFQHLLLMTFAPPLILLGAPLMPLLHGLPRQFVQTILGPLFRWPPLQNLGVFLSRPVVGWLVAAGVLVGWHVPSVFTLALQSEPWHIVEHSSFFAAGLLFWWPVVQPWPSAASAPQWSILLYLFLATLPCDILSGFLVFSDRVVYPIYLSAPRHFEISVLADQQCAGAIMWTCVTIIYLSAAAIVTHLLLGFRQTHSIDPLASKFAAAAGPAPRHDS